MESNKEALDLIQKCLDDRPYAAIRVIEIMARLERVKELLKEQEAVVRCKDCKHRSEEMYDYCNNPNDKRYVCQINDLAKKQDWFCADGERNSEDGRQ